MFELTRFQRDLLAVTDGVKDSHGVTIDDVLVAPREMAVRRGLLDRRLDTRFERGPFEYHQMDGRPDDCARSPLPRRWLDT